jgi:hypothetical protein
MQIGRSPAGLIRFQQQRKEDVNDRGEWNE